MVYKWNRKNKLRPTKQNLTFTFTQKDHQFPFPNNNNVTVRIPFALKKRMDMSLHLLPLQVEMPVLKPVTVEVEPLRRRAAKLIRNLALIAHSILTKPELEGDVLDYMETNKDWPQLLNDSLSYEMSRHSAYSPHINPYDKGNEGDPGMKAMLAFYEWLVRDYQRFKKENAMVTSIDSIKKWCQYIADNIKKPFIPAPSFIKDNKKDKSDFFITRGLQYFVDLVEMEKFIEEDARKGGRLSKILVKENLYKRSVAVRLIDGRSKIHAEIRLLECHLKNEADKSDYYGITKLCCGFCTLVMKQFQLVDYRGSHNGLFGHWILGDELRKPEHLKVFLGEEVFALYDQLVGDVELSGRRIAKKEIALNLIESLSGINDRCTLSALEIDPGCFIPDPDNLYPDGHAVFIEKFSSIISSPRGLEVKGSLSLDSAAPSCGA